MTKILIIDREKSNAELTAIIIKKYIPDIKEIIISENRAEAINLAEDLRISLFITDTICGGPDFTKEVRKLRSNSVKIICFSGNHFVQEEMLSAGCDDFLKEPIGAKKIIAAIKRALEI